MGMSECLKNAKLIENIKPNWAKFSSFQDFTSAYMCWEVAMSQKA